MTKTPRVTISRPPWARLKTCKEPHYIISVGGRGMTMAHSKEEALHKQHELREDIKRKQNYANTGLRKQHNTLWKRK
jgi:hypothetical protein